MTNEVATSTSHIAAALPDGLRYWRVRPLFDVDSIPGTWSGYRSFTVDTIAPSVPSLTAPAPNGTTADTTPAFSWAAATGANYYEIQIDDDPTFSSPLTGQGATATYTVPAASALSGGRYYWRVRSRDSAGNWSVYSLAHAFTLNV